MSTSLASGMAKGIATRTLQRVKGQFTSQNNQGINWQDFNYPPCLHIIHFRLSELKKPVKTVILLLYISFLCIPAICILNFLSTIIQVATYAKSINMLYTILNILIFIPLAMTVFYWGYRGICHRPREDRTICFYKIFQIILVILWIVFAFLDKGCFNGFVKISVLLDRGRGFCVFLSVLESLGYLLSAALGLVCLIKSRAMEDENPTGTNTYASQQL